MARRRAKARTIFLPWERQGTLLRRYGLSRARPFVIAALVLAVLGLIATREWTRGGVRATRATILTTRRAVDTYRADREGECPPGGLEGLVERGYLTAVPRDAWGNPLRLVCPARHEGRPYDLASDGPDGQPGGLDRVE